MTIESISQIQPQNQLFTQSKWSEMYKEDDYGKTSRSIQHVFHWLIALNQKDRVILPYIAKKTNEKKYKALFRIDLLNNNLTPLLIATIRRRFKIVKAIIEACPTVSRLKQQLNHCDKKGWTALHHAAVSSVSIYNLLIESGANIKSRTHRGLTPESLMQLTDKNITIINDSRVYFEVDQGVMKSIEALVEEKILQSTTGITMYRDVPYYSPGTLHKLWKMKGPQKHPVIEQGNLDLCLAYKKLLKNPTNLVVKTNPYLANLGSKRYGLYVSHENDIALGNMVTTYSGEVLVSKPSPKTFKSNFVPPISEGVYISGNLDPTDYGNAGRFANTGWPNAILFPLNIDGIKMQALIACDTIKKNEEILWDYGPFCPALGFGNYKILGREKMHDYFRPGLMNKLQHVENIPHPRNHIERVYQAGESQKLIFPLNSPAAAMDLHFNGIVNAKELYDLVIDFQKYNVMLHWEVQVRNVVTFIRSYLIRICEVDKVSSKHKISRSHLNKWVLNTLGELTVMQILKGFDIYIQKVDQQKNNDSFDWAEFFDNLSKELVDYDWLIDDDAPLHTNRVRLDIYNLFNSFNKKSTLLSIELGLEAAKKYGSDSEEHDNYSMLLWVKDKIYREKYGYKDGELPESTKEIIQSMMKQHM